MPRFIQDVIAHLPLDFRVLYRQFLLRVIDLEALSIQADVVGFIGQFAGVLIMVSVFYSIGGGLIFIFGPPTTPAAFLGLAWRNEQFSIATMMLVVGLYTVVSWDATFPDRRDVMVLSPLPVAPHTILFAKLSASGALLGLAILTLNSVSGFVWPFLLGMPIGGYPGFFQFCAAWWFTMIAASVFLYCAVLTVQGFIALLFPRRIFLLLSAVLQLAAFGLFLGVYFMQPSIKSLAAITAPQNQWVLAWSPSFWFFALFNQLNGSLPSELAWLASRAWIGLGAAVAGAAVSLILCYLRTMKRTVEEPDLVPGARGWHWAPRLASPLQSAIVLFSLRSLIRSRQHRVAFAFFLAIVFAIALSVLRQELSAPLPAPLSPDFLIPTFMMMVFAVLGLRCIFSLPISLTANWVLRTAQLCPSQKYIAATRWSLLLLAVVPAWLLSAFLSLFVKPFHQVMGHLAALALLGYILAEISLIGFYKVPFTCSYLPGKANIQVVFWGFLIFAFTVAIPFALHEQRALQDLFQFACLVAILAATAAGLWVFNRHRAESAVLYFEELPDEVIMTLGLISPQPYKSGV
jgi:hypothetical protein